MGVGENSSVDEGAESFTEFTEPLEEDRHVEVTESDSDDTCSHTVAFKCIGATYKR